MNEEERATWKDYCDEVTHFFGEIVMRQSKKDHSEVPNEDDEGDDVKSEAKPASEEPVEGDDVASSKGPEVQEIFGTRIIRECNIESDLTFFCENICTLVPAPMWPDPDKEPLP
jgi:hypothetical protein